MKSYRPYSPGQSFLLPPSPNEWLPESHLAYFVLDLLSDMDLGSFERSLQAKDARGERPFAPRMMLALLVYGYAVGVFSSRKIERATHEDVAFRVLAAGEHPHFTTINGFRLRHRNALGADLSRRQKPDQFRELGFRGAVRIDRVRVAFATDGNDKHREDRQ